MSALASPPPEKALADTLPTTHFRFTQEMVLVVLLAVEIAVFSVTGSNFATRANAFQIARLSVEIGLLALALTPVIITGGIDLSVGSLMGLSAVLFKMMVFDARLPVGLAATLTLLVGVCAGGLNATLIGVLRLPPLIVTLGTYSLFRGLAEGFSRMREVVEGNTNAGTVEEFPGSFLFMGQGYLFGVIPTQLPLLVAAIIAFWILLHRTTAGRALYAIGLSPEGAKYAGIPVQRHVAMIYVLCGFVASISAIVYVARLGQAKADAGMGYELAAITAVVLGGTSIFGGRGTIVGTVLGLFAIAVLQNGLQLSDLPSELAGILTGAVLLVTITLERLLVPGHKQGHRPPDIDLEWQVKNSQVAILSAVILLGACIVAGSNWLLVRHLAHGNSTGAQVSRAEPITVAMMPKALGNAYFIACRKGAEKAAEELGVNLIWDGPTEQSSAKQNEIVEAWITRGVDVIAVSVDDQKAISTALRKAREHGIKVVTWDSDADPDARDFFVNQATPQGIGETLTDQAARILNNKGEFAIISASLNSANMQAWEKEIRKRLADKYPAMKVAVVRTCDDKQDVANKEANTILNAHPDVKLIMAICSPAVPGAAEAVKQAGRNDVKVIGLGLPNENRDYIKAGITDCIVLWKTEDLGYLTVCAAQALKKKALAPGSRSLSAGRLGNIEVQGDNIMLGTPFVFNKGNIDQFDF
jgi:rhamnose transport system permease protein